MKILSRLPLCLSVLVWLLAAGPALAADGLSFDHAWIRALPPGMQMTAGFGVLQYRGAEPVELTAFSSPQFGDVSLHLTETTDGVNRMREIPSLRLEPGAAVELAPGGYHLMLTMPQESFRPDQPVTVVVTTAGGEAFSFTVPVERR
jgi:copper(I)-binding protein